MSFLDIFDETRRKIGGAIGNQVDNFRVGLNVGSQRARANVARANAQNVARRNAANQNAGNFARNLVDDFRVGIKPTIQSAKYFIAPTTSPRYKAPDPNKPSISTQLFAQNRPLLEDVLSIPKVEDKYKKLQAAVRPTINKIARPIPDKGYFAPQANAEGKIRARDVVRDVYNAVNPAGVAKSVVDFGGSMLLSTEAGRKQNRDVDSAVMKLRRGEKITPEEAAMIREEAKTRSLNMVLDTAGGRGGNVKRMNTTKDYSQELARLKDRKTIGGILDKMTKQFNREDIVGGNRKYIIDQLRDATSEKEVRSILSDHFTNKTPINVNRYGEKVGEIQRDITRKEPMINLYGEPQRPLNARRGFANFGEDLGKSDALSNEARITDLYHQTSPEIATKIEKEGFKITSGVSRQADDVMPDAVFLKTTDKEIPLSAKGKQIKVSGLGLNKTKTFADRTELESFLRKDPEYNRLKQLSNNADKVAAEKYRQMENQLDMPDAQWEAMTKQIDEEMKAAAGQARARATQLLKEQGFDAIVVKNDVKVAGGKGIETVAVLNPEKLSPQSTQGAKGITPKVEGTPKIAAEGIVGVNKGINTSKFDISKKAQQNLDETVKAIKPELEQVKGATLKNEEVVDAAKASKILSREVNPEATKKATAAVTRLRQEVAAGAEGKGLTKDFIENLKVLKSYSADAGRKLQAFNIKASPETSIKESIIADLVGLGKKSDDLIKAAKGVDFDNPKQVSKFYRQFVKPSLGEVLDEYRYINLLSSPQTHIVNAFSNLIQGTVLNPATKLYTGAIDSIGSTLTGKQRTAYMREVPAYSKGFINSMGDAFKEASEVMKGNKFVERPDINRLSTGKLGPGEYVMRALEAGDVFFRKMIKGGEMEALAYKASRSGKKIPKSVMEKQAADAAEYFVFRKAPDPTNKTGQGAVLSGIDKATEAVYKFRNVPGVKWVIPFVQTPMNILKQGLEYSPLGVSTMVGNTNKTQQLAKALIGSTVLAGAATLESTWDAPTSKNEKEEFYASGRKPYSVKIGDNWVSYSKLGPLAYPMAMAAAVKWYFENDPKATSTDSIDKMTKMLGGIAGFFSDQSYLSGIGDLVDVAKGEDYAIKGMLANFGKQLVPLTSLQGWVARQLDPIYRQPKTLMDQLKTGIPGLSKSVESYKDPLGNDSVRQNLPFNAWSPVNVNPANQQFEDIYQKRQLQKRSDAEAKALTSGSKTLSDGRVAVVINDEVKKFDSQQEADQAINKEKFKNSDKKAELIDGTYYYKKSDGDVGTYTEQEYNYKLRNAKMDIAYNKKDYKGWVQLANEKLKDIEKQYNEADPLTQQELLNDYQDLAAKIAKYSAYGGFTKGKAGKKFGGITLPTSIAKIPIRQAKAPAFKNISKTPRIAIKTNKPKMISKSTLANMR